MGWTDYLYGGGLFGGYGGYDQLSEEARRRANRQGLMTMGASIMGNAVGPFNQGFMRNISSALLAGRESFESMLDREAEIEARAQAKKKLAELEAERERQKAEEEDRRFHEWETKEGQRTQWMNTLIERTGKSFEELNALSDDALESLYSSALFPKPEKEPGAPEVRDFKDKTTRQWDPKSGSWKVLASAPADDEDETDDLEKLHRQFVKEYAAGLKGDVVTEEVIDPRGGSKIIRKPRVQTYEERLMMAERAWQAKMGLTAAPPSAPKATEAPAGSGAGLMSKWAADLSDPAPDIPASIKADIERELDERGYTGAQRIEAKRYAYENYRNSQKIRMLGNPG